ncbi:hypothetical protein [Psychrobacter sp. ANT_WB68]|uniref:hypothetical protein n=1 Tax=Psychrobacter sp. ANT_WB68 TaxID=2597355 RepID=UPI0011F23E2D|nr:hypothetical protein [Psychrobacter sp. ANT_WB68]KAA0915780.1 hypothetical protein FQ084_04400 [Psychrobacter sp. ANT_WB68]
MGFELTGSDLTRAMLERGDEQVWCAVSNESEQDVINTIKNIDINFMMHIVAFEDECFLCEEGGTWKYAVPIKKAELSQNEVGL